jgi:MoxR-like ATPase
MVVATQNPIEHHGTHPLPDSELDRFLLRIRLGYPSRDDEKRMIADRRVEDPMDRLSPVLDADRVCRARAQVRQVEIPEAILESILSVVDATRHHPAVEQGVSPRGSLMLCRAAQAAAFLRGGRCVDGHDVGTLLGPVLGHRIVLGPSAGARGAEDVLREIAARHPIP